MAVLKAESLRRTCPRVSSRFLESVVLAVAIPSTFPVATVLAESLSAM